MAGEDSPQWTEETAAAALAQAALEDGTARSDLQQMHNVAEANKQASEQNGSEGTTAVADSFTSIDPQALPEELQPIYRSMQADYTRKNQALSERGKQFEALEEYGGADAAIEAVQFATALATDPNYALKVHESLTEALVEAGLTPRQADAEATRQITEVASAPADDEDDYSFGADPKLTNQLTELQSEIAEMRKWRSEQEERELQMALQQEVYTQETNIKEDHPEWKQADINRVYDLAYSTGGNLLKAAELYSEWKDATISEYLQTKSSVPVGVTPTPASAAGGEQPTSFKSLFDPGLESLVRERLAQEAAAGNI